MPYNRRYNKVTKKTSKRRTRRSGLMLSGLGYDLSKEGIKASFESVKGVLITGLVAAGSAVLTRKLFDAIEENLNKKDPTKPVLVKNSLEENLAIAAVGVAGGIMITKYLKKKDIGIAFAIGALVLAGSSIIDGLLVKKAGATEGLGYIVAEHPGFRRGQMALGAQRIESPGFQPQVVPQMAGYGSY